jgi:hypothetical protein
MFRTAAKLFLLSALGCAVPACVDAQDPESPSASPDALVSVSGPNCATLWAGQNIDAGTVCVTVDSQNLTVDYSTHNAWQLTEAHAWVGTDLLDMPQTSNGNPKIGLFPYASGNITGATSHSFAIPLANLPPESVLCETGLFVVAHAALEKNDGTNGTQTETGWAGDDHTTAGASWARYFTVTFTCDEEPPPPETGEGCETAFAYGATTFVDLGLTQKRWGWQLGPLTPGLYETALYAGAGQNDITKGTEVGGLTVAYDGATVTVDYGVIAPYTLAATHLYVGTSNIATIAPGQYGHTHELGGVSADSFTVSGFNGEPVYVVAHAETCGGDGGGGVGGGSVEEAPELY